MIRGGFASAGATVCIYLFTSNLKSHLAVDMQTAYLASIAQLEALSSEVAVCYRLLLIGLKSSMTQRLMLW